MHDLSKKAIILLLSAFLAISLSACGRKPKFNDLKQPEPKTDSVVSAPQPTETLDGQADGPEPVAQAKPNRKFFLDFLL